MWKNGSHVATTAVVGQFTRTRSHLPPLSHEERLALIYAPLPIVTLPSVHAAHALGARRWNLSQMDQEREAW